MKGAVSTFEQLSAVVAGDGNGGVVISVEGELDLATSPRVVEWVSAALDGGAQRVCLSLERVSLIDSSGLRALHVAHDTAAMSDATLVLRRSSICSASPAWDCFFNIEH